MAVREKIWTPVPAADGYVANTDTFSWQAVRAGISGTAFTKGQIILRNSKTTAKSTTTWKINRAFIPFDLSGEPKGVRGITSLTLKLFTAGRTEDAGSAYRYLQVIGDTTQASPTTLENLDFNDCGDLNNPTVWSDTQAFSLFTVNQNTTIALNSTALTAFEAAMGTGFFLLGLRLGNDLADAEPSDPATENLLAFSETPQLRITEFVYPQAI